jgi:CDP-diacylglycerol--serine O-phosphatidyltransferase
VKDPRTGRRFRRGVSILPSLFTTGNLFLGFWAVVRTLNGRYTDAAPFIIWAAVLDMLDGRIARLTGTTSEFGGELDSLADVISFGVAPALLVYSWGFHDLHPAVWMAAFLFVVCGTLRLARFNVQRHVVDGRYFVGLPIPAAAAQIATLVLAVEGPLTGFAGPIVVAVMTVLLGFLMVSTFRYPSFKGFDLRSRRSYLNVLLIALLFMLVAVHPVSVLLAMASVYVLSAPLLHLVSLVRRRRTPPASAIPNEAPHSA